MGTTKRAILLSRVFSREQAESSSVDSRLYRLRKEVSEGGQEVAREVVEVAGVRDALPLQVDRLKKPS